MGETRHLQQVRHRRERTLRQPPPIKIGQLQPGVGHLVGPLLAHLAELGVAPIPDALPPPRDTQAHQASQDDGAKHKVGRVTSSNNNATWCRRLRPTLEPPTVKREGRVPPTIHVVTHCGMRCGTALVTR